MFPHMKNVLVTGGSGFIGSNLVMELQSRFPEAFITVLEDFRSSSFKNLLGFKGDILAFNCADKSWMTWARGKKLDIIYHMASITDTTIHDQKLMMNDNVEGFRNILELGVEKKAPVIYASSAATYGTIDRPIKESDAGRANNIYGYSKWIMDQLARSYYGKTRVVGLRFFNVFGPKEDFKGHAASMIYQLCLQMMEGKRPRIFKWGEQKRDHIYVKDVVSAALMAHTSKQSTVMNLGTGRATSFNEIVDALNEALGTSLKPDYFDNPYASFYQNFTQADMSHHEAMTGFRCKFATREGILDYVRNHLAKK
ncbi:MAG TPA: ADP-glyceromanno-heptose 6-epimerase [Candidatus Omnitrophota bacterium]|nr:ADP-glyceromanno-heptose 6-epimerase [Candidatus Omnitrophota bacterium]